VVNLLEAVHNSVGWMPLWPYSQTVSMCWFTDQNG